LSGLLVEVFFAPQLHTNDKNKINKDCFIKVIVPNVPAFGHVARDKCTNFKSKRKVDYVFLFALCYVF